MFITCQFWHCSKCRKYIASWEWKVCPVCGYDCASTNERTMLVHVDETGIEMEEIVTGCLPVSSSSTPSSSVSDS